MRKSKLIIELNKKQNHKTFWQKGIHHNTGGVSCIGVACECWVSCIQVAGKLRTYCCQTAFRLLPHCCHTAL